MGVFTRSGGLQLQETGLENECGGSISSVLCTASVCVFVCCYVLTWIRVLGFQKFKSLYEGQELVSVLWPMLYCIFDSTTEGMPDLFFIFIRMVQLLCVREDSLEGMCPQRFADTPH